MTGTVDTPASDPLAPGRFPSRIARLVAPLVGGTGLFGSLSALTIALYARLSAWCLAYLVTLLLFSLALLIKRTLWRRWLFGSSAIALCLTVFFRTLAARAGDASFSIITLPDTRRTSMINSLVPESDGALLVAAMLRMNDGGEPLAPFSARLHGFSGNFDVYCWHLALATKSSDMLVACPSVGPVGDWWTPHGLATVRTTLGYLRARGIEHIHLAGLSNGARGAAVLAPHVAANIESLILISGASTDDPPAELPLLVIQGERDAMMPPELSRDYLSRATGPHTYVSLAGGHFVFLSQTEEVNRAIGAWLHQRAEAGRDR